MFTGPIQKMTAICNDPIEYHLPIGDNKVALNEMIGHQLTISFLHKIHCIQCGRQTAKSFQQGYCYPCYGKLLDCNLCMIHPERCKHPEIPCPDTWEHAHCTQSHIVYLANASGPKVGITRTTQVPTRWIDQGAIQAMPLFKVANRSQSGQYEMLFKQHIADKTNWRKMLSAGVESVDLFALKKTLFSQVERELEALQQKFSSDIEPLSEPVVTLSYPIQEFPSKLTGFNLEKTKEVSGKLLGIKGQYLLLDTGVLNVRKHSGYNISLSI